MTATGGVTFSASRGKCLQSDWKRSSSVNAPQAQVEVQMNSRENRDSGRQRPRSVCIVAAHAGRPRIARQDPSRRRPDRLQASRPSAR